ncbi:TolC family protein [Sphingomonas sp. MMS24-J13]|uniref:TolC family protein n=1 Tax=Sphingomonas sp. MMS24-J13 TaxID=3238686 RepID=UPI00384AE6E4
MRGRIGAAALCAGLASCATYRPAPFAPNAIGAVRAERSLPAGQSWTTAALLTQALDWAPSIRESAANYRSLAAAAHAARVPLPAALQLTAEYSHDDNPDKPWLGSGTLDLPLDFGGRRNARVDAADLAVVQARYDYGEAVWSTRSAIRRATIDRLFADRLAPLAARVLALRQDRHDKLQARVRAGEEARPISIAAQLELAMAERRIRDIAARRAQADVALANAIGVDPAAVAGIALAPLDPAVPILPPADLARLRGEASAGRRDILRAIIDYDLAENAVRLEIASQYPAIRIQPGYTYERGLVKLPFGVNLQLPPIDFNRAAIAAAEAKRAQAGAKLETLQSTVLGDVDKAAAALDAQVAAERLNATRDLPAARHLADRATANLRGGEGDRVDEDAARATAAEAEFASIEASRLAWLALVDLEDALRRPTDPRDAAILETAMKRLGETK